jgi:hypothetical protein
VIRIEGTITYQDGRTETYEATQREIAAWERYALRNGLPTGMGTTSGPLVTMTRYLAYATVTRAADDPVSFEVWDAGVAEVDAPDPGEADQGAVDPTLTGRSADSWPPSQ